jgi:hypothetical protein
MRERARRRKLLNLWHTHAVVALGVLAIVGVALIAVPALMGETASEGGKIAIESGFAFLTAAIISFFFDFFLSRFRDELHNKEMAGIIEESLAEHSSEYGLAGVCQKINVIDILENLKPGQELWWMDTYPLTFAGDLDAIHKVLASGRRVRLLVLNPRAPALTDRVHEIRHALGLTDGDLRQGFSTLCSQLKVLSQLDESVAANLEVRAYDGLPGAPMFLVIEEGDEGDGPDEKVVAAYTSYYLLESSQNMPYIKWRSGDFAEKFIDYFKKKWYDEEKTREVFPRCALDLSGIAMGGALGSAPTGGWTDPATMLGGAGYGGTPGLASSPPSGQGTSFSPKRPPGKPRGGRPGPHLGAG